MEDNQGAEAGSYSIVELDTVEFWNILISK